MGAAGARRFAVRRSPVHGRGVFALTDMAAGELIVEYRGELISWTQAQERYEQAGSVAGHTMFFERQNRQILDGSRHGNSARWINHGCEPNCEAVEDERGRIVIEACTPIAAGAELFLDYRLSIDGRCGAATRAIYRCACGALTCRGTMLAASARRAKR